MPSGRDSAEARATDIRLRLPLDEHMATPAWIDRASYERSQRKVKVLLMFIHNNLHSRSVGMKDCGLCKTMSEDLDLAT